MEVIVKSQPASPSMNAPAGDILEPHLLTFFSLDGSNITSDDKRMLAEVSRSLKGKEPFEAIDELRNIRFRLGTPQVGITPLQHLHKYLKIKGSILEQESQLKAMENA